MRSPWLIDYINKPFAFEKADFHRREQQHKKVPVGIHICTNLKRDQY